jgi:hypothetical protein
MGFGSIVGSLIIGVIAWFATHLIANPLLTVYRLRQEAPEVIIRTAAVGVSSETEEWKQARDLVRGLAARMAGANAAALPFVRRGLVRCGVDLEKAVSGLIGLSNSFNATDGSRALYRATVERALRLPMSDSEEYLQKIEEGLRK